MPRGRDDGIVGKAVSSVARLEGGEPGSRSTAQVTDFRLPDEGYMRVARAAMILIAKLQAEGGVCRHGGEAGGSFRRHVGVVRGVSRNPIQVGRRVSRARWTGSFAG